MLKDILEKLPEIEDPNDVQEDYYSEELESGYKLVNKGDGLELQVIKEDVISSIHAWPGSIEDYKEMLKRIEDDLSDIVPRLFILVMNQEKEINRLKKEKKF